jgi:hypothetical protein
MKRIIIAALLASAALTAASPSYALTKADQVGETGVSGNFTRTIHVTPSTPYINVDSSETVNLDVNGTVTTWKFDGVAPVLNLQQIIPGAPSVNVYVAPSDRYAPEGA